MKKQQGIKEQIPLIVVVGLLILAIINAGVKIQQAISNDSLFTLSSTKTVTYDEYYEEIDLLLADFSTFHEEAKVILGKYAFEPQNTSATQNYISTLNEAGALLRSLKKMSAPAEMTDLHEEFVEKGQNTLESLENFRDLVANGLDTPEKSTKLLDAAVDLTENTDQFAQAASAVLAEVLEKKGANYAEN